VVDLLGRGHKKRLSLLRSNLTADEAEHAEVRCIELLRTGPLAAKVVLLVTDQRLIWTYEDAPPDVVVDLWFKEVVACLGADTEKGLIMEAAEPRYFGISEGTTTVAHFRFKDDASAARVIRLVEQRVPPAALDVVPDLEGTGDRQSLSETAPARLWESYTRILNDLAESVDPTLDVDAAFRANLRDVYEAQDDMAAFDMFGHALMDQARVQGLDPEELSRFEGGVQAVRAYLAKRETADFSQPPAE
jgi:hypothetical protein